MKSGATGVIFLAVVWAGYSFAGEISSYTVEECISRGLSRSGVAVNARLDERISYERIRQARSQALPHVALTANFTRLDELQVIDLGGQSTEMGLLDNYSAEANIRQTLFSGGKVSAALKAASSTRKYAEWARKDRESELKWKIKSGINKVLLSSSYVDVYTESVKQLNDFFLETEARNRVGTASDFDVLTAKVRVLNETPELTAAKNALDMAMEDLRITAALDEGLYKIEGSLALEPVDVSMDELESYALANRPACAAMEAMTDLFLADVAAAKAERMPNMDAFFTYNGANSYRFVSFQDEWQWHWSAGIAMNWNFWDGDLTRGKIAEKKLEFKKSLTDLSELHKNVRLSVRKFFLEMKHAEELAKAGESNVGLAKRALEIADSRYKTGLSTYLEFTDANLAFKKAQLIWLSSVCSHMNAVSGLDHASGGWFEKFAGEVHKPATD